MKKIILLNLLLLLIFGCKKKAELNEKPEDEFYFSDTTSNKPTGATFTPSSLMDSIQVIDENDSTLFPVFGRLMIPDSYEITTPKPGRQINSSCVGWTLGYGLLSQHQKIKNNLLSYDYYNSIYSPTFIYNYVNGGNDNGLASIGIGLRVLKNFGSCKWYTMDGNTPASQFPNNMAILEANNYKIDGFARFQYNPTTLKFYLSRNYLIPFAANVDNGFITGKSKNSFTKTTDGRLIWRSFDGSSKSGHAMLICGYDNTINAFKVLNSWGDQWGNNGYIWIDYSFMSSAVLNGSTSKAEIFIPYTIKQNLTAGLIAYYPFNNNANDESGNNQNGTIRNTPSFTTGISGQGIKLIGRCDGGWCEGDLGDHILIPMPQFNSMNSFSLNIWVKEDTLLHPDGSAYISFGSGHDIYIGHYGNEIRFASSGSSVITVPYNSTNTNSFKMYTLTFDNGTLKAYQDGILVGTKLNATKGFSGTVAGIARHWSGAGTYTRFSGSIDQVRVYNKALSLTEITSLYTSQQ